MLVTLSGGPLGGEQREFADGVDEESFDYEGALYTYRREPGADTAVYVGPG